MTFNQFIIYLVWVFDCESSLFEIKISVFAYVRLQINDGRSHLVQIRVESDNFTLTVDAAALLNNLSEASSSTYPPSIETESRTRDNVTVIRHLALTNPMYFGGAPSDRLEAAGRILNKNPVLGMTGELVCTSVPKRTDTIPKPMCLCPYPDGVTNTRKFPTKPKKSIIRRVD